MPCKKLQIPPGPSVDHICMEFYLAGISDWNLKHCVASGGRVSVRGLFILFYFHFWFQKPQGLYCLHGIPDFRGNHSNLTPESKLSGWKVEIDWKLHLILQLSFVGRWRNDLTPLRREAATFWRRQEKDLTEGLTRRGERREERAAGRSPSHHPPPPSQAEAGTYRNEEQKQEESMLLEAGRGRGWPGEGLWAQSLVMVASTRRLHIRSEFEKGGEGGAHCPALWVPMIMQEEHPCQSQSLPPSSSKNQGVEEEHLFELHVWPSRLCTDSPREERKSSKTNQIHIWKYSWLK